MSAIARRDFLKLFAACVAAAALPKSGVAYAKFVDSFDEATVFSCPPLPAGNVTINAMCPRGLLVTGVNAIGGETLIALPKDDYFDVYIGPVIQDVEQLRFTRGAAIFEGVKYFPKVDRNGVSFN